MASVHGFQSKISNFGGTRESGKQILVEVETSSRWEVGKPSFEDAMRCYLVCHVGTKYHYQHFPNIDSSVHELVQHR